MYLFYYERLRPDAQKAYVQVYEHFLSKKTEIIIRSPKLKDAELPQIISAVFNDHPELYTEDSGRWDYRITKIKATFPTPIKNIFDNPEEVRFINSIIEIAKKHCHSDYEFVKFIHDFVVNNVNYDFDEIKDNSFIISNHHAYGALNTGKAVCEGIARLTQLLLNMCGIKATYCRGDIKERSNPSASHGWVVVCVDGNYYHLDVSHDICNTKRKINKLYNHFLLPYNEIINDRNVYHNEYFKDLPCATNRYNYFHYNNCYFTSVQQLSTALQEVLSNATANRWKSKFFQFKLDKRILDAYPNESWNKMCMSEIKKAIDIFSARNKWVKTGYDTPYYFPKLGIYSINFTFS